MALACALIPRAHSIGRGEIPCFLHGANPGAEAVLWGPMAFWLTSLGSISRGNRNGASGNWLVALAVLTDCKLEHHLVNPCSI